MNEVTLLAFEDELEKIAAGWQRATRLFRAASKGKDVDPRALKGALSRARNRIATDSNISTAIWGSSVPYPLKKSTVSEASKAIKNWTNPHYREPLVPAMAEKAQHAIARARELEKMRPGTIGGDVGGVPFIGQPSRMALHRQGKLDPWK